MPTGLLPCCFPRPTPYTREQMRKNLSEPYRTLIGHFRHEIGHYYWDISISRDDALLKEFRAIFGDERKNYGQALKTYYANGAPKDWRKNFISKYATSHPWEDWAETWAHYLHIMDTLETAFYFGLTTNHRSASKQIVNTSNLLNPYKEPKFEKIFNNCIPIFFAINSLNRGMGISDIYPFVISKTTIGKLKFIHRLIRTKYLN